MKSPSELVAGDIMTRALVCARPEQELIELERLLIDRRISGVPVVEGERLIGVISRSDIARVEVLMESLDGQISGEQMEAAQADGFQHTTPAEFQGFRRKLEGLRVRDAMRDQVVTCRVDTPIVEIAREMVQQHIHRVIVVDGTKAIGIVSSMDLVRLVAGDAAAPAKPPEGKQRSGDPSAAPKPSSASSSPSPKAPKP